MMIKLQFENKRFMSIPIPIPFHILQELLDCFQDLLTITCIFVPKVPDSGSTSPVTVHSVKGYTIAAMRLLDSLSGEEPYNLAEVTTGKVKVLIKIR